MLEDAVEAIYINADEIERELNEAAQLDPRAPQTRETALQAQTEATRRRELLLAAPAGTQSHFVFETVFSDPYGYKLAELQRGVAAGYFCGHGVCRARQPRARAAAGPVSRDTGGA